MTIFLDGIIESLEKIPKTGNNRVLPSAIGSIISKMEIFMGKLGEISSNDTRLSSLIDPIKEEIQSFSTIGSLPGGWPSALPHLSSISKMANSANRTLSTDKDLEIQTVDEVISDLENEFRLTLFLSITANTKLSEFVNRWTGERSEGKKPLPFLDPLGSNFVESSTARTIPMTELVDASSDSPFVIGAHNIRKGLEEMQKGGTPPPLYRTAYNQWFTSILAIWEDSYRPRLATAHSQNQEGLNFEAKDIKSSFFNSIRLIRNDIAHHEGICIDSAKVEEFDWLIHEEVINPTPMQMLELIDRFPKDELKATPKPGNPTRQKAGIPYNFDAEWVEKLKNHCAELCKTRKGRPDLIKEVLDEWMKPTASEQ